MRFPPRVAASALALFVVASPSWAQDGEDLAMSFAGDGTWIVSPDGWIQVSSLTAKSLLAFDLDGTGDDDLVVDFGPGVGVWIWANQTTWFPLHAVSPSAMVVGDLDRDGHSELIMDLPGIGVSGWSVQSSWRQIHPRNVSHLAVGNLDGVSGDDLVVDFDGLGVWTFQNNATWSQLHALDASALAMGDLDGDGQDDVIAGFPGYGLWARTSGSGWRQLHPFDIDRIVTGDIDANGTVDLAVSLSPPYSAAALLVNGGPVWTPLNRPLRSMVFADRDGDGRDDFVADRGPGSGVRQDRLWAPGWNAFYFPSEIVTFSTPVSLTGGRFKPQRIVTFSGLSPGTPYVGHVESGITVTPDTGRWGVSPFGWPVPAVIFSGYDFRAPPAKASLRVTKSGTRFTFSRADLYSSVAPIHMLFIGYLAGVEQYRYEAEVPASRSTFVRIPQWGANILLDELRIELTQPANTTCPTCGGNPMGIDNLVLR